MMNQGHRPHRIHCDRNNSRVWLLFPQTRARCNPQITFKLPIDPIDPFVMPTKPFELAQRKSAHTNAPIPRGLRLADQPSGNCMHVLVTAGLKTSAALAHAKSGPRRAHPSGAPLDRRQSQRSALTGPCHFFAMACVSKSACRCASAESVFKRRFSSWS